jgi:hypothetical protein
LERKGDVVKVLVAVIGIEDKAHDEVSSFFEKEPWEATFVVNSEGGGLLQVRYTREDRFEKSITVGAATLTVKYKGEEGEING